MQSPAGESVLAHLRLADGVEEELEVPGRAGKGAKQVVGQHGYWFFAIVFLARRHVFHYLAARSIDSGLDNRFLSNRRVPLRSGNEVLIPVRLRMLSAR